MLSVSRFSEVRFVRKLHQDSVTCECGITRSNAKCHVDSVVRVLAIDLVSTLFASRMAIKFMAELRRVASNLEM